MSPLSVLNKILKYKIGQSYPVNLSKEDFERWYLKEIPEYMKILN